MELRRPEGGLRLTGPFIESRNPGRPDEVVGRLPGASSEDVEQAVHRAVQLGNPDATAERRADIMCAAAAIMRTRRDDWQHGKYWNAGSHGGKRMRISRKRSIFWNFMRQTGAGLLPQDG